MLFTKRLREPIKRGEITCSVRIWLRPRVRVGQRYKLDAGHIRVDKLHQIEFDDITPSLAPLRICRRGRFVEDGEARSRREGLPRRISLRGALSVREVRIDAPKLFWLRRAVDAREKGG